MRVSVALCTHNGERFVAQQIRSILDQTRPVQEIIISDDASADLTVDIVERTVSRFRLEQSRPSLELRVMRNATALGVTANFEKALTACSGDLIALSDQDDLWHPGKIARLVELAQARPDLLLLASDARMITADGAPLGASLFQTIAITDEELSRLHGGRAFDALMRRNVLTGATALVRRELIATAVPFPSSWVHDEWLAVIGSAIGGVDVVEEELIDYRQHGANQIGATSLTGTARIERLRAPRTARNARLLTRAQDLADRLPGLMPAAPGDKIDQSIRKLEHERARSAFPASRWRRPLPVWREWRTGRYASCGLGVQDVLRDLVQPV